MTYKAILELSLAYTLYSPAQNPSTLQSFDKLVSFLIPKFVEPAMC